MTSVTNYLDDTRAGLSALPTPIQTQKCLEYCTRQQHRGIMTSYCHTPGGGRGGGVRLIPCTPLLAGAPCALPLLDHGYLGALNIEKCV